MTVYARIETGRGTPLRAIARHMLGLYHGQSNARLFRRILSDADKLQRSDVCLLEHALGIAEPKFSTEAVI